MRVGICEGGPMDGESITALYGDKVVFLAPAKRLLMVEPPAPFTWPERLVYVFDRLQGTVDGVEHWILIPEGTKR